jgi:hypothetical protein
MLNADASAEVVCVNTSRFWAFSGTGSLEAEAEARMRHRAIAAQITPSLTLPRSRGRVREGA